MVNHVSNCLCVLLIFYPRVPSVTERGVSELVLVWLWRMWAGLPRIAAEDSPAIMGYVNGTSWRCGLELMLKINVTLGLDRLDNVKMSWRPVLNI